MSPNGETPRPRADAVIFALAARQHGIVARRQLLQAGLSRHLLDHRVGNGHLCVVHAGVYRVGPVIAPRAREMAAILACDRGTISHRTAAAVLSMGPPQRATDPVDVTLRGGRHCGRRPGIRAHRTDLRDDEITRVDGLPVTSPARTLLDLSDVVSLRELERALAVAERARAEVRDEVRALLGRHAGRAGTGRLRHLLDRSATAALSKSSAEELLRALIEKGGLPEPETNVMVHGCEVDCYWRKARLVVEVDGYAYHSSPRAFVRDRQRDSLFAAGGIQVVRLSWHQLTKQPAKTLVHLAQTLVRAGL